MSINMRCCRISLLLFHMFDLVLFRFAVYWRTSWMCVRWILLLASSIYSHSLPNSSSLSPPPLPPTSNHAHMHTSSAVICVCVRLFYWVLQFCFHFYWPLRVSHCRWFSCSFSLFPFSLVLLLKGITIFWYM